MIEVSRGARFLVVVVHTSGDWKFPPRRTGQPGPGSSEDRETSRGWTGANFRFRGRTVFARASRRLRGRVILRGDRAAFQTGNSGGLKSQVGCDLGQRGGSQTSDPAAGIIERGDRPRCRGPRSTAAPAFARHAAGCPRTCGGTVLTSRHQLGRRHDACTGPRQGSAGNTQRQRGR